MSSPIEKPGLDGLLPSQVRALNHPLRRSKVSIKPGKKFPYLSGPNVINHLNRIFGFGGWSTELGAHEIGAPYQSNDGKTMRLTAWCYVKLTVKRPDGQTFERVGYGSHTSASSNISDLYDQAPAAALTFATRNAAITMGHQLGLAVTRVGKTDNWQAFTSESDPEWPDFGGGVAGGGNHDVMPGDDLDGDGATMPTTSQQMAQHQAQGGNQGPHPEQYQHQQQAPQPQVHQHQQQQAQQPAPTPTQAPVQQQQPAPVQQQVQQPQQQPQAQGQQSAPANVYNYQGPPLDDGSRAAAAGEIRATWIAMTNAEKASAERENRAPNNVALMTFSQVIGQFGVALAPAAVPQPAAAGGPTDQVLVALLAEFRRRAPQGFAHDGHRFPL